MNAVAAAFADAVRTQTDAETCAVLSSDISGPAVEAAAAVLLPRSEAEVAALVRIALREGIALTPRGGGLSYTGGCLPGRRPAAIVDTAGLHGIAIAADKASVTAGAGVTWAELYDALDVAGLRAPSFGPLSGIGATLGGLAAQNGGFFGSAAHGALGDATLQACRMVVGNGETVIFTAADRVGGLAAPQPLAGECGAFGIRTTVTLATIRRPAATAFASFAFETGEAALAGMLALAGVPGLGEAYVFDPGTHANLARSGFTALESAALAGDLLRAPGDLLGRVGGLLRSARAGTAFVADLRWSLHLSFDGTREQVQHALSAAQSIGGRPIPDTIPRVTRARPFRRIKALLGPDGEAWLPLHGVFALDRAAAGLHAAETVLAAERDAMRRHAIRAVVLIVLTGTRCIIEPQLFWPDALTPLHRLLAQPDQVTAYGAVPANPAARAAVHALRRRLTDALDAAGAAHFQIGRYYGAAGTPPGTADAWMALKHQFDPAGIMNPGVLGL